MVAIGVQHFIKPALFVAIIPQDLPLKLAAVYLSGAFEILGGIGLLVPRTRRMAGLGLVALYFVVFPANLNMALNNIQIPGMQMHPVMLWLRLPFQVVFILWACWVSRPVEATPQ